MGKRSRRYQVYRTAVEEATRKTERTIWTFQVPVLEFHDSAYNENAWVVDHIIPISQGFDLPFASGHAGMQVDPTFMGSPRNLRVTGANFNHHRCASWDDDAQKALDDYLGEI